MDKVRKPNISVPQFNVLKIKIFPHLGFDSADAKSIILMLSSCCYYVYQFSVHIPKMLYVWVSY
jgi:hypothetical protein